MFLNFALYKERREGISFHLGARMSEVIHGDGWENRSKNPRLGALQVGSDSVD